MTDEQREEAIKDVRKEIHVAGLCLSEWELKRYGGVEEMKRILTRLESALAELTKGMKA